jgi:hypothetical protein
LTFSEITVSVGFTHTFLSGIVSNGLFHTSKLEVSISDELSTELGLFTIELRLRLLALLFHFLINQAPFLSIGERGLLFRLYRY